ncbi:MAG: phosphatidylinositol mannoside acyltransferase [Acidimicrobiia bacterium]
MTERRPRVSLTPTYLAYRAGAGFAQVLPGRVGEPTARALGRMMAAAMPARRRMVERHLRRTGLRGIALQRAVNGAFDSYGRYWLELFRLPRDARHSLENRFSAEGFEHIVAGIKAGNGVIAALPHVGGFDFAGAWLAGRGLGPLVVVEPVEPPELFEWFADVRRKLGMEVVALGPDAGAAVLRALKDNRVVCLLCDRDLTGDGVEVEFFGERTTLPAGPATLALRTGAPLIPVAAYFLARGRHFARIGPPVPTDRRGRLRDDVARVTQSLARRFEELIRAAPDQWHLMQPNWPSDYAGTDRRPASGR